MTTRSDKAINLAKVAKVALTQPLASQRDIAEQAGVGLGTANRALSELEQTGTKDPRIVTITDTDLSIVEKGQREIDRRLSTPSELEKMRTGELSTVLKDSTARYSLFRGNATDESGGMKNIESIDIL